MRADPHHSMFKIRYTSIIFAGFLSLGVMMTGCYEQAPVETTAPPVPVRTAKALEGAVTLHQTFTGVTNADPVRIVPRIRGTIEKIPFVPGNIVEVGDVLYEIEKIDYENSLATAEANYRIAIATAAKAKADFDRETNLQSQGQGFTTQADVDRTKAMWEVSKGEVEAANVAIAEAKKQLERCTILAPVRGKINRTDIQVGNMVDGTGPNPPELTTIMPMDPIHVYFQVTDRDFDRINHRTRDEIKKVLGDQFDEKRAYDFETLSKMAKQHHFEEVILFEMGLLSNIPGAETVYPYKGIINYNENKIDSATGTITIRGEIDNPNYLIFPGYICNVRVDSATLPNAVTIEEKAVCYDLSDVYVWVVNEKGTPEKRIVTIGEPVDVKTRIITSGLSGGETYLTEGFLKVREGCLITEMKDAPNSAALVPASPPTLPPLR